MAACPFPECTIPEAHRHGTEVIYENPGPATGSLDALLQKAFDAGIRSEALRARRRGVLPDSEGARHFHLQNYEEWRETL